MRPLYGDRITLFAPQNRLAPINRWSAVKLDIATSITARFVAEGTRMLGSIPDGPSNVHTVSMIFLTKIGFIP